MSSTCHGVGFGASQAAPNRPAAPGGTRATSGRQFFRESLPPTAALDSDHLELAQLAGSNAIAVGFDHGVGSIAAEGKRVNHGGGGVGGGAVEGADVDVAIEGPG